MSTLIEEKRLTNLKEEFLSHKNKILKDTSSLCTFKNRMIGASLLGVLVVTGGYLYTYTREVSNGSRYLQTQAKIDTINSRTQSRIDSVSFMVNDNRVKMAVLVSRLETTNSRLKEIIGLMRQENLKEQKTN
jgi:hypothetical protein